MSDLRDIVAEALQGGQALDTFDQIVAEFSGAERGLVPLGAERSAWQILEHMRIALRDILDYADQERGAYVELRWPDNYWPEEPTPTPRAWVASLAAYRRDKEKLRMLAADQSHDLLAPFPWEPRHSLLREVLLAASHEAYHLGQLVELKRWLIATNEKLG